MATSDAWDSALNKCVQRIDDRITTTTTTHTNLSTAVTELTPHAGDSDVDATIARLQTRVTRAANALARLNAEKSRLQSRLYASLTADQKTWVDSLTNGPLLHSFACSKTTVEDLRTRCAAADALGCGAVASEELAQTISQLT